MAVHAAPTDKRSYCDDVLRTLRQLAACEHGDARIDFRFDVPLHQYSTLRSNGLGVVATGELSLAIYNDLKLSEYVVEDDNQSTRESRRFSLTARGRKVAACDPG